MQYMIIYSGYIIIKMGDDYFLLKLRLIKKAAYAASISLVSRCCFYELERYDEAFCLRYKWKETKTRAAKTKTYIHESKGHEGLSGSEKSPHSPLLPVVPVCACNLRTSVNNKMNVAPANFAFIFITNKITFLQI